MHLHEYQAKNLLADHGVPTPKSVLVNTSAEIANACETLGGEIWVVKAQVHAGGRGKGGGVVVCQSPDQATKAGKKLLNKPLITPQTDKKGLMVNQLLIEQGQNIASEFYLSCLLDRQTKRIIMVASTQGGMDIEQVASNTPNAIIQISIDPSIGVAAHQIRRLGFALNLSGELFKSFGKIAQQVYQLFVQKDLNLIEINPLIITKTGQFLALDAKMDCEDNSLYRHLELLNLKDNSQGDVQEQIAADYQLNYIALDGNIGCMVNGAGLAMATMDLIDYHGGKPANFLDVGGGTTAQRVAKALEIILSGKAVKSILINIFGGIVRCDLIAQGILSAIDTLGGLPVPIVVRLEGTNAPQGLALLAKSTADIYTESDLTQATKKAVELAL